MVDVGSAIGYLDLDTSKFKSALEIAQKELQGFGDKSLSTEDRMKSLGDGLKSMGGMMSTHLTLPLLGVGTASVATAANFEKSMSNVAALSGATGADLQKLTDTAKQMGATTKFSATEAADALGYMALAGWDVEQSTSALPGVLDLAASSGMGLADASDLVTDYLSAFGEEANQAGRMADVLAYAQANSNTTTAALGEAFKNCAVNANAFGLDIEQTTAVLGKLADQGLKGSEAGTALNAVFRDMSSKMENGAIQIGKANVAITDSQGNFKSLTDIVAGITKATDGLSESEKMVALQSTFTADSIKAMGILMNTGSDSIAQFTEDLYNSEGAASKMAATMNDNLSGQLTLLKSALEAAAISIGEALLPVIKKAVEVINDLVDWFNNLDPNIQTTIVTIGGLVAALGPMLLIIGNLLNLVANAKKGFGLFSKFLTGTLIPSLGGTALSIGAVSIPVWGVIAAIAALIGIGYILIKNWDTIKAKCSEVWENIKTLVVDAWNSLKESAIATWEWITNIISEAWNKVLEWTTNLWTSIIDFITTAWDNLVNFLSPAINFVVDLISMGWQFIYDTSMTIWNSILGILTSVWEFIKSIINLGLAVIELAITVAWTAIKNVTTTIWEGIKSVISAVWNFLSPFINAAINVISAIITNAWNGIKIVTSTVWNVIRAVISTVWNGISSVVSSAINFVKNIIDSVWNGIRNFTSSIWNSIKEVINTVWNGIKDVVQKGVNAVKSTISSIFDTLSSIMTAPFKAAQKTIEGILGGITKTIKSVTSGVKKVTNMFKSMPMPGEDNTPTSGDNYPQNPSSLVTTAYYDYQRGKSSVEGVMRSNESMLRGIQDSTRELLDKPQSSSNVNTSNNINIVLNIEKIENTDNRSIEEIADQLAFYIKRRT